MYWKQHLSIFFLCLLVATDLFCAPNFLAMIKDFFSIHVDDNILDSINQDIIGKISVKNITFVIPNRIDIDDIEVLDERGERMLYSKHVTLKISLLSLLTSNIRISEAHVEAPFFRYTIYNETHNVINAFASPPSIVISTKKDSDRRITIEHIKVDNGSYDMYHDADVSIDAHGVFAEGNFYVDGDRFVVDIDEAHIAQGLIKVAGMELPLTNLITKNLFISDQKVSTNDLTARYEKAQIKGSGTVFIEEDRYDVTASIDAPAATYPRGLVALPFVMPAFKGDISMSGILNSPEIDASILLADTNFNGLLIKGGEVKGHINEHKIVVTSSKLKVGKQGSVEGKGVVDIDRSTFNFETREKNILASELGNFLSLQQTIDGIINASSRYSGQFIVDDNIRVVSKGRIEKARIEKIHFDDGVNVDVDVNYTFDKRIAIKKAMVSDLHGLRANAHGHIDVVTDEVALDFSLISPRVQRYIALSQAGDSVEDLRAEGQIAITPQGELSVNTPVSARKVSMQNVQLNDVSGELRFAQNKLALFNIAASFYDGHLQGQISIDTNKEHHILNGDLLLSKVQVKGFTSAFTKLPVAGRWSSTIKLGGSIENPEINFLSEIENLLIDKLQFRFTQFAGEITKNNISLQKLALMNDTGTIEGRELSYNFPNKNLRGDLLVTDVSLLTLSSAYGLNIEGDIDGNISLDGSLDSPAISANLVATKFSVMNVEMGDGPMTLELARRPLLGTQQGDDVVFSLTSHLLRGETDSNIRFSYALNRHTINTEMKFSDLLVNTAELYGSENAMALYALLNGEIVAEGSIKSPFLKANIVAREFVVFDPRREQVSAIKMKLGPAIINVTSKNSIITGDICAELSKSNGVMVCNDDKALRLSINGPFHTDNFSLDIKGAVDHEHVENLVPWLRRELSTIDAKAQINGKLTKKSSQPPFFLGRLHFDRIVGSLPNVPKVILKEPVTISIHNDALNLESDAVLDFSPGLLTIHGSASSTDLDVNLRGAIPLNLARFFVPIIQRAEGLINGNVSIFGTRSAVMLEGNIVPAPSSTISFRRGIDTIEVREGSINFHKTSPSSFVTHFNNIKLGVGDGRLFINGNIDRRYARKKLTDRIKYALTIDGSNVVFRDRLDFVETDFHVESEQLSDGQSTINGAILVTDGSAHRQFDLRNFVAEAQGQSKQSFTSFFENFDGKINLDIAVRQFRASARISNLDIETNLRGQMTLIGSIVHPKLKGALFVSEGMIRFPATTFDLSETESQIVLDENSARMFDPKITVVATQVMEKREYPIEEDTNVELSLRGNIDRLSLGLRPLNGDMRLSQLRLFLLLLSPGSASMFGAKSQSEALRRGAQNVAMKFSGEVFLQPLAQELQKLFENKTRTRFQFGSAVESTGVSFRFNWKLGPRIELTGSYAFLSDDAHLYGREKTNFMVDSQVALGDLNLKLLLFDHRPWGPLSVEANFGSIREDDGKYEPRGKIRLKYRVWQQ